MHPIINANYAHRLLSTGFFVALVLALCPAPTLAGFEDKTNEWCGKDSIGGGGASFGDFNDDGFVDLSTHSGGWTNDGGKKFTAGGPGGAVIWGDINNDGHLDYAVVHGPGGHFLGDGEGGFKPGTPPPGPFGGECMAASWGDINNDGLIDIYYGGGSGHTDTMWRQGPGLEIVALYAYEEGTFRQHGKTAPIYWTEEITGKGVRSTFQEIRREDGFAYMLDRTRNMTIRLTLGGGPSWWSIDAEKSWNDLYEFKVLPENSATAEPSEDKWSRAFSGAGAYCRSVVTCDFDEDNDADFYISNYWLTPNWLIVSDGQSELSNYAGELNATGGNGHSIGACWGDVDNDGYIDLFAGNFAHPWDNQPHSKFLRNLGPDKGYKFEDKGECGVHYQESYASPTLGDYDNDGDLDIYFTTVYGTASYNIRNYPVLYRNDGNWHFTNVTDDAGLAQLAPTYQAAWGDVNNDGFLDLATAGKLFINKGNDHHWLKIRLQGDGRKVNSSAIGARVRIKLPSTGSGSATASKTLTRQVEGGGVGQGNQNDLTLHFGLGNHGSEVQYTVTWTNGEKQSGTTPVDRMIRVEMRGSE
ncbi:MAG: FG-GAP-like repeat-containing protein [Lentisphaeria bacterium]|nr:FG-GAP-like repeat-containing protein [Lentisphaeria bacterium]